MGKTEKIQDVLASVISGMNRGGAGDLGKIWEKILDASERRHSFAATFKEGKLTVFVDNSISLQNFVLKRNKIIEKINLISEKDKVTEICFRLGNAED
jgi:hypothetical protein